MHDVRTTSRLIYLQAMLLQLRRYRTPSGSGVKGRRGHCSSGTKDSCEYRLLRRSMHMVLMRIVSDYRGALGAWIKNMEPAVRDALED